MIDVWSDENVSTGWVAELSSVPVCVFLHLFKKIWFLPTIPTTLFQKTISFVLRENERVIVQPFIDGVQLNFNKSMDSAWFGHWCVSPGLGRAGWLETEIFGWSSREGGGDCLGALKRVCQGMWCQQQTTTNNKQQVSGRLVPKCPHDVCRYTFQGSLVSRAGEQATTRRFAFASTSQVIMENPDVVADSAGQ